jgi:hypothetical protein
MRIVDTSSVTESRGEIKKENEKMREDDWEACPPDTAGASSLTCILLTCMEFTCM